MRYPLIFFVLTACSEPVEQSSSCAQWVTCIDARDAELGITTNIDRFIPDGTCWSNPEQADLCDKACSAGLVQLAEVYTDLPGECL